MPLFRRQPDLTARVVALETALAAEQAERTQLAERLAAAEHEREVATQTDDAMRNRFEARLAELSGALDNQLREVSGEVEAARKQIEEQLAAADALTAGRIAAFKAELERLASDEARIDELSTSQVRIANELARQEIALHEELAAVADRLSRQRPTR